DCDFRELVDLKPLVRLALLLAVAGAAALTFVVVTPEKSRTAIARVFDPFGDHVWPPDTQLSVVAPEWLARGEPFVLRGEVRGVVPERGEFRFAMDAAPVGVQLLPITGGESLGSFSARPAPK